MRGLGRAPAPRPLIAVPNVTEVGTLAVDGWAVTFGTAMRGQR